MEKSRFHQYYTPQKHGPGENAEADAYNTTGMGMPTMQAPGGAGSAYASAADQLASLSLMAGGSGMNGALEFNGQTPADPTVRAQTTFYNGVGAASSAWKMQSMNQHLQMQLTSTAPPIVQMPPTSMLKPPGPSLPQMAGQSMPPSSGTGNPTAMMQMPHMHDGGHGVRNNSTTPNLLSSAGFFVNSDIRSDVLQRSVDMNSRPDSKSQSIQGVPQEVQTYRGLCLLDGTPSHLGGSKSPVFGCVTSCYSAIDSRNGVKYVLRRVHNFRPPGHKCVFFIEAWKKVNHPNIVRLKEVFTSKCFGDNSLIFVYDYIPLTATLSQHILALSGSQPGNQRPKSLFPESLIWNYIVQLTAAMRSIHMSGLSVRSIDVTKILIDSRNRLYLSGCCVLDVLLCENMQMVRAEIMASQQEDMKNFGKVTMAMACGSVLALLPENFKSSYDLIHSSQFSEDLRNLITYLFSNSGLRGSGQKNLNEIMPMIGARFYTQFEAAEVRGDQLEGELMREAENGRLLRLLAKLGAVNERPEFNMDVSWSETGDRYLLKLFRDYLFHQVTDEGRPWLDMSHAVACLNKLDAGSHERITLVSRDGQNALVVTYADLKHCIDGAFEELQGASLSLPKIQAAGVNDGSGDTSSQVTNQVTGMYNGIA